MVKRGVPDVEDVVGRVERKFSASGLEVLRISDSPVDVGEGDFAMAFGGDGTLLKAFHLTGGRIPIIGVKDGTYGLLMELEMGEALEAVGDIVEGRFAVEEVPTAAVRDLGLRAINEILLLAAQRGKAAWFSVEVDGTEINRFLSDGVIFSTPLGSMAYSLSTGGPIVDPRIPAMVISPLAPWPPSMEVPTRALVIPPDSEVRVRSSRELSAIADGQVEVPVGRDVELHLAEGGAKFLSVKGGIKNNFYARLIVRISRARYGALLQRLGRSI